MSESPLSPQDDVARNKTWHQILWGYWQWKEHRAHASLLGPQLSFMLALLFKPWTLLPVVGDLGVRLGGRRQFVMPAPQSCGNKWHAHLNKACNKRKSPADVALAFLPSSFYSLLNAIPCGGDQMPTWKTPREKAFLLLRHSYCSLVTLESAEPWFPSTRRMFLL